MLRSVAKAAAVALILLTTQGPSLAGICSSDPRLCFPPNKDLFDPTSTEFDLGIDVSDIGLNPRDVVQFVASLPPYAQRTLVLTCTRQLANPTWVRSRRTLQFCGVLLQG